MRAMLSVEGNQTFGSRGPGFNSPRAIARVRSFIFSCEAIPIRSVVTIVSYQEVITERIQFFNDIAADPHPRFPYIASFNPARISQRFIGKLVAYPQIMAICIISQYCGSNGVRCGRGNSRKKTSAIQAYIPI